MDIFAALCSGVFSCFFAAASCWSSNSCFLSLLRSRYLCCQSLFLQQERAMPCRRSTTALFSPRHALVRLSSGQRHDKELFHAKISGTMPSLTGKQPSTTDPQRALLLLLLLLLECHATTNGAASWTFVPRGAKVRLLLLLLLR
jgi:hypothetical protein